MRKGVALIYTFCFCLTTVRGTISAQALATSGQRCSPAMLDVSALPTPPSFTYGGHLYVLEAENISPAACSLVSPTVHLLPSSDTYNQPRYVGNATENQPLVLEPHAWVHLLFVWTSRAGPELVCDQYSGIRLDYSYSPQQGDEPGVEIRNLWIRACGPIGYTGYRAGRYNSASSIPQEWFDWYGPGGLHGLTVSPPTPSTEIAASVPQLKLTAQAKRMMLGDRFFSLRLDFPRLAAEGCAFNQLRKRESDGSTVISIQECDNEVPDKGAVPAVVPRYHEAGVMGLYMNSGNLDFMPQHAGPLEYNVIAPIGLGSGAKPVAQFGRARVELVARDPSLPKQVAILDPLLACTATQLRVESLSPVISTPQKTLRAYNATNISAHPCSLAGVPRMRGLDGDDHYQPFLPPACPNCENEYFAPRSNGRIDLNPGETAHLLVAASGEGTRYCTVTPKLELSLNRVATPAASGNTGPRPEDIAQSLTVPFEGQDCVSIDTSAWRQGSYDNDPLNFHQPKLAQARESASKPAVPTECNKPELLAHGSPYPMEGKHDPEYALSMEQHQFRRGEPITLFLWTNNSTDHAIELGGCREPGFLRAGGYVLYDAYGHRILSKRQTASDKQCKADPSGFYEPLNCTANIFWSLSAHTCTTSGIDLGQQYDLPPGEYTISTHDPGDRAFCPRRGEAPYKADPAKDIIFSVLQP